MTVTRRITFTYDAPDEDVADRFAEFLLGIATDQPVRFSDITIARHVSDLAFSSEPAISPASPLVEPRPTRATCLHCGEPIERGHGQWFHVIGPGSLIYRCDPEKSGKPYGMEATPADGD